MVRRWQCREVWRGFYSRQVLLSCCILLLFHIIENQNVLLFRWPRSEGVCLSTPTCCCFHAKYPTNILLDILWVHKRQSNVRYAATLFRLAISSVVYKQCVANLHIFGKIALPISNKEADAKMEG